MLCDKNDPVVEEGASSSEKQDLLFHYQYEYGTWLTTLLCAYVQVVVQ
jgi:hypothetical protein